MYLHEVMLCGRTSSCSMLKMVVGEWLLLVAYFCHDSPGESRRVFVILGRPLN